MRAQEQNYWGPPPPLHNYTCNKCGRTFVGRGFLFHECKPPEEKPWPTDNYEDQGTAYDPGTRGHELQGRKKAPEPSKWPKLNGPDRDKKPSDWAPTWSEFWHGSECDRFWAWFREAAKDDPAMRAKPGYCMVAWKAAKEDALSVARQSDSHPAPERAETAFDSPGTDQVEPEMTDGEVCDQVDLARDYDLSIYTNPDAAAWAHFFMETKAKHPTIADDEATMLGWFANAMMAMHDHLKSKEEVALSTRLCVCPECVEAKASGGKA